MSGPRDHEDYIEYIATTKAVRASTSGKKAAVINTLDDFFKACREARGFFRVGGMVVDITTASAVVALADYLDKVTSAEKKARVEAIWNNFMTNDKIVTLTERRRKAVRFVVDRAWKAVTNK